MRRLLLAAVLLLPAPAAAGDVSVHAEVDATRIGVQDRLQLTITVEGGSADLPEGVALPGLENLRAVGGPFLSTQVSIVNGQVSQSKSYSWVLEPIAPGPAEIGAARVGVAGGEKTTSAIAVEVVKGSVRPQRSRPASPFDEAFGEDPFASLFGSRRPRAAPKLEVAAIPSRKRAHVGEPILLTYFLYTQTSVTDIQLAQAPQYPGFWVEDLDQPKTGPQGERATLEGETYARYPIFRKLLFPTKAGSLTIPAATFRVGLPRVSFFDGGADAVERTTAPLAVAVDPIPAEPGFSGAVGSFTISDALDPRSVALGDAATLRFTVEGRGNLKWVDQGPRVEVPGAKVYPPQTQSDLKAGPEGISGSKTWEYVIVPETSGRLEVPPLSFSYFDPAAGVVKRAATAALGLEAAPSAASAAAGSPSAAAPLRAGGLALRSDLDLPARGLPVLGARAVLLGLGLALLLHAAIGSAGRLADRRRATGGRPSARHGVRGALAELDRTARGGLGKEDAAARIERTLHGVFGPIEDGGVPPASERERAVRDVLQEVQFIRYAPQLGDYSEKIREVAEHAAEVVRRWA